MVQAENIHESKEVYDLYSPSRQRCLLSLAAAVYATILPMSDTIILPVLATIEKDLDATPALVTASMSAYLLACGIGFMLWGPAADWVGRLPVYHASLILVLGTSIGAALSPSIAMLLVCRSLQGLAAAGPFTVGNAIVADVYPPSRRGFACGVYMMPGMLCPIIAPFLGAALSHGLGWRSTMWAIAIMAALAELAVLIIYRETHPDFVAKRVCQEAHAAGLSPPPWAAAANHHHQQQQQENAGPQAVKRQYQAPWRVAWSLLPNGTLMLHWLVALLGFCCIFVLLVQLPTQLASAGLGTLQIGLSYLCTGAFSMAGSLIGGWVSDRRAGVEGVAATARVELVGPTGMLLLPAGMLLFGWVGGLQNSHAVIASSLLGASVVCWSGSSVLPPVYTFTMNNAQEQASAAAALLAAWMNILAAGLVQISPIAEATIGIGAYNSIIAGVIAVAGAGASGICLRQRLKCRSELPS